MENFKKLLNKLFLYNEPKNVYNFSLSQESSFQKNSNKENGIDKNETHENEIDENEINKNSNIYTSLNVNLDYLKVKYNSLINSDIVIREFNLSAKDKEYKSCLIFIDGMVNSELINNFVLRPLMTNTNSSVKTKPIAITNNISVRRVKKFNLENYIYNFLIPQNNIKKVNTFSELISSINNGECILLVDTLDVRIYFRC